MEQIVFKTKKGNVATDSLKIAKAFGKTHKVVLKAIDNLECDAEFNRINYEPISYVDAKGRKQRAYALTAKGEAGLVNSFSVRRADLSKAKTYFMLAEGLDRIKIGKAVDVTARHKCLQCGCPVPLVLLLAVDGNLEKMFHTQFRAHALQGEWFAYSEEIKSFIKSRC